MTDPRPILDLDAYRQSLDDEDQMACIEDFLREQCREDTRELIAFCVCVVCFGALLFSVVWGLSIIF